MSSKIFYYGASYSNDELSDLVNNTTPALLSCFFLLLIVENYVL